MRFFRTAPFFAAVFTVVGCSHDNPTAADRVPSVGVDGGTVASADGLVQLVIPAGALTQPTPITITPATNLPSNPRLVPGTAYTFGPEGLQFAKPVQLTIQYDSLPAAFAGEAGYLWLHKWVNGDWQAVEGAVADTVNRRVQGTISGFSQYGAALSRLADAIKNLGLALAAMTRDAVAGNAIEVLGAIATLLQQQHQPEFQALAQPVLDALGTTACNAYVNAVGIARDTKVDDYGLLVKALEPVYAWTGIATKLGVLGGCPGALTLDEIQTQKFTEFVDFYIARLNQPDFTADFPKLVAEVNTVFDLRSAAQQMSLPDIDQRLATEAQDPLMVKLRESAYTQCSQNGVHQFLGQLLSAVQAVPAPYSDNDILTDLQECATHLSWRVSAEDGSSESGGPLGGGGAPGTAAVVDTTGGFSLGTIQLSGDVQAFRCADGGFDNDALVVSLNGTEVQRLTATAGNFFASPLSLDLGAILQAAGVNPKAKKTYPLEIARESLGCGGSYVLAQSQPIALADVYLRYPPPLSYFNDFSGSAGSEWSTASITGSPNGERFLGAPFGNDSVSLTLTDLPSHDSVVVELDFYALLSLDGSHTGVGSNGTIGPDLITFVLDGSVLRTTTFSNNYLPSDGSSQAYPGNYPGDSYPPGTGAESTNALGYPGNGDTWGDSEYHLTFTVQHTADTLVFSIRGSGQQGWPNEGWGIDNISVTTR